MRERKTEKEKKMAHAFVCCALSVLAFYRERSRVRGVLYFEVY